MRPLLLLLTSLAVPLAAHATTRYVAPGGADAGACASAAAPCATIAYAVGQSAAGDLVSVAAGLYDAGAVLDRAVTIEGAGQGLTTVLGPFTINAGVTAVLRDLTVDGARVTNDGDAALERVTVRDNVGTGVLNRATMAITDGTIANNDCSYYVCSPGGIRNYGTLTLLRTSVLDNDYFENNGWAGGIYNDVDGTLTIVESLIEGNSHRTDFSDTGWGGGIHNEGALAVVRSTIRNNSAESGGGIWSGDEGGWGTATLAVYNSTISDNYAAIECGAIRGDAALSNSTVSGNTGGLCGDMTIEFSTITGNARGNYYGRGALPGSSRLRSTLVAGNEADCSDGTVTSHDYNVLGDLGGCTLTGATAHTLVGVGDPLLGPLADNGGPTQTHALLPGSPALDAGACTDIAGNPITEDQRGQPRPYGPACDVGAVEQGAFVVALSMAPVDPPVAIPPEGGSFAFTVAVTNLTAEPVTLEAWVEATQPGGQVLTAPYGPLLGPVTVTLGPGEAVERTLLQRVPAGAVPGYWTYTGYVGAYPDSAVAAVAFPVTKWYPSPREAGRRSVGAPTFVSEGTAWSAVYAESGRPVARGDVWASGAVGRVAALSAEVPAAYALLPAFPNPFAREATLRYGLPAPSHVRLAVHDLLGREVAVLVDAEQEAGWHEARLDGRLLPAGVYFVRMGAGGFARAHAVTLVR